MSKKACQGLTSPYQSHQVGPRLDLHLAAKSNLSSFTQRVMSAKLLRLKQLQNQLAEANLQLNELYTENRLLRALQKRQDLALNRYEGAQAQLPQLVNSHHEEVRVLRTKYRNLKAQYRDVSKRLKDREVEVFNVKEQNAHLLKLSRDRHLGEREALSKQVVELESTVSNQKNTIQVLNRRILLETKNLKHQLHVEMQHHKATQMELQETLIKMENLQSQLEQTKERQGIPISMQRLGKPVMSSCSRLPGLRRPAAATALLKMKPGSSEQHSNKSKSFHEFSVENVRPATDPSSDQPDSSMATFSEKTNEFSTSVDSSPEHGLDVVTTSDSSSTAPALIPLPTVISKCINSSIDEVISISNNEVHRKDSLTSGDLETDYKKALDMLSELSSKDCGDYEVEMARSLSSADLLTTKHVASLANAAFTVSKDLSSSFRFPNISDLKQEDDPILAAAMKEFQRVSKESSLDALQKERRMFASMGDAPPFLDNTFDTSVLAETKSEKNSKMPWEQHTPIKADQFSAASEEMNAKISRDCRKTINDSNNSSLLEDDENFHKEALLKALKAIDDETVLHAKDDSGSEDTDSGDNPIPKPILPLKLLSPIHSSGTGIKRGLEHSQKRRPFK